MCSQWITFSLGMATLVPAKQLLTTTLIALANQALDQAKAAGGNCNVRLKQSASLNAQANFGNVCRSNGEKANLLGLSMRE
jgi:GGDEF domain-containing protein